MQKGLFSCKIRLKISVTISVVINKLIKKKKKKKKAKSEIVKGWFSLAHKHKGLLSW